MICLLFAALLLGGCRPLFVPGQRSQDDFTADHDICIAQNSQSRGSSRHWASTWTDWDGYSACMAVKGYNRVR